MTTAHAPADETVWSKIVERMDRFTPTERKVAVALLTNYPEGGLRNTHGVAELAKVSQATVVRFSARLDYRSFADLQRDLREEIQKARTSPAEMYHGSAPKDAVESLPVQLVQDLALTELPRVADLLLDRRKRIWVTGGRWSYPLAIILSHDLVRLRPGTRYWPPFERAVELVDFSARDVVVMFDFRRYSDDMLSVAQTAVAKGARIVLITDMWISPIAAVAQIVLPLDIEFPPFDSMIRPVALCEAISAEMRKSLGSIPKERLDEIDANRPRSVE